MQPGVYKVKEKKSFLKHGETGEPEKEAVLWPQHEDHALCTTICTLKCKYAQKEREGEREEREKECSGEES